MKKAVIFLILLFTSTLVLAEGPGATPLKRHITDCLQWSGLYFCENCYCNHTQLATKATLCQSNNNAQGFEVHYSYKTNQNGVPYGQHYKIYYKYCYKFEYGQTASPGNSFNNQVADVFQSIFDHPVQVSELLDDLQGNTRLYVIDQEDGGFFETTWSADGEMLDFHTIDPETDEGLNYYLEKGLSFISLDFSPDSE